MVLAFIAQSLRNRHVSGLCRPGEGSLVYSFTRWMIPFLIPVIRDNCLAPAPLLHNDLMISFLCCLLSFWKPMLPWNAKITSQQSSDFIVRNRTARLSRHSYIPASCSTCIHSHHGRFQSQTKKEHPLMDAPLIMMVGIANPSNGNNYSLLQSSAALRM